MRQNQSKDSNHSGIGRFVFQRINPSGHWPDHGISVMRQVFPTPVLGITSKVFSACLTGITGSWKLQTAFSAGATDWKEVTTAMVTMAGQAGVIIKAAAAQQCFRFVTVP